MTKELCLPEEYINGKHNDLLAAKSINADATFPSGRLGNK